MPCTISRNGRVAVTLGSFWRSEPAAALRGLANGALPASTRPAFSSSKAATGKKTSPRTAGGKTPPPPPPPPAGGPPPGGGGWGVPLDGAHVVGHVLTGAPVA